ATPPPPVAPVLPRPTVDSVYYREDTLLGTGPGPAGPLSGLPSRRALADRRPVAVVLDNIAPDARPQTGLNRASLVFETLAEGGITRLMAVYLERDAPIVGPVRSARIYFNAWAAGLKAIYAHAGGNNDALYQLGTGHLGGVANADGLNLSVAPNANDVPFWRSADRIAPHNFYTSTYALRAYMAQIGGSPYGSFGIALPHRVPDPYFHRSAVAWIDVGFSSYDYNVHWTYDRATNAYLRSVGGVPSVDAISHRQTAASNVVVLFTTVTPDPDPYTPLSIDVHTQGSGRALYFRDGHLVIGRWHKHSILAPLQLLDPHGKPQPFNPGQTWIEVVPAGAPVTYQGT
ncbi:MAG TPA: DUF3048 domain-containing protein, partial [Chloroflexota bacterium]|nr:DUF3048 domain-containing protein [Chloroflexota bacterium]